MLSPIIHCCSACVFYFPLPILLDGRVTNHSNVALENEGDFVVFDDSFEHEVWWTAPTDEMLPRVLLAIDLVHPDLRI